MKLLKFLAVFGVLMAPAFAHADPISAVIAIGTMMASSAGAAALVAGTISLATVSAGVAFAGGAIMAIGAVTKDKNLEKVGSVMSIAGSAGGLLASAGAGISDAAAANTAIEGAGGDVNIDPHDLQLAAGSVTSPGASGAAAGASSGGLATTQPVAPGGVKTQDFGGVGSDASVGGPGAAGSPQGSMAGSASQPGAATSAQPNVAGAPQANGTSAPQANMVQAPDAPGSQGWMESHGGMTPSTANPAAGGGGPATQAWNAGKGLINGVGDFTKANPGLTNMAGQVLQGMAAGRGQLAAAQYQNQAYMQMQQRFSDSITGMAPPGQYIKPGGQAVYNGYQPRQGGGLINGNQG